MTYSSITQALIKSQEGELFEDVGDFQSASTKNREVSEMYTRAKNSTCDPRALKALDFLSDHYSSQSHFQETIHEMASIKFNNMNDTMTPLSNAIGSSSMFSSMSSTTSPVSSPNKFKLTIDSTYMDDTFSQAKEAELSMYSQFYDLFIAPWQLYWNNHLQYETDSAQVKQTYFNTIHHTERNLNILMQIANYSNVSPTTPNSLFLPSSGAKKMSLDEERDKLKQQDDLAQRLKKLQSSLSTVQVTRLEKRVQELENLLALERRLRKESRTQSFAERLDMADDHPSKSQSKNA